VPVRLPLARILQGVLIVLLAFQLARLGWAVLKPVGPVGEWRLANPGQRFDALKAGLSGFDPFFRGAASDSGGQVTSLTLKLFGIRIDNASGGGGAIIAGTDGVQNSYQVGEEIAPGVRLKAVAMDYVLIDNGGAEEKLFIDQSSGSGGVPIPPAAGGAAVPAAPAGTGAAINAASFTSEIGFAPRTNGGRVTGFTVNPKGNGNAFRTAGLQPGDVLVSVNGVPIKSIEDSIATISELPDGGNLTLQVERGGQVMTLNSRTGK
jgi:general secretion pathway protein C